MKHMVAERIAGTILVLGGLIGALAHAIHPDAPENAEALHAYVASTVGAHLLLGSAVLLVCIGLPFLCERLSPADSITGLLSYPLLFMGLMSGEFRHCPVEIALFPELERLGYSQITAVVRHLFSGASVFQHVQSISLLFLLAGVFVILVAARTAQLPRWPAVFLIGFLAFLAATFVPALRSIPAGHLFPINLYLAFASYGAVLVFVSQPARTDPRAPDYATPSLRHG